jgi:hypothetical protein
MNSTLGDSDGKEPLHTIKMPNGKVSEDFPKTLNDLFELDGARLSHKPAASPS